VLDPALSSSSPPQAARTSENVANDSKGPYAFFSLGVLPLGFFLGSWGDGS
jgi:hypothetical protein